MENKKHPNKEINKYRPMFLLIGMILSLALVLAAFEYKSPINSPEVWEPNGDPFDLPIIPQTIQKEPEPPKPKQFTVREIPEDEDLEDFEIDIDIDFNIEDTFEEPVFEDIDEEEDIVEDFVIAETPASFPGEKGAWYKFLRKNLKYPKQAQRAGIEGRVYLQFYVDASGNLSDIEVTRGIGGGCDEEAIRVLKKSPKWNPGLQRGRPVKSPMAIYVIFKLK